MATKLSDDELRAITDSEIRNAIGGNMGGKLSEQRRRAEYYYLGLPKGDLSPPDIDGRSTFVDTTIRNQIEWMIPSLMKTFCSGENVVEFSPAKEGDDEKAKLATDYINYQFYKKNNGYTVLQTAIRDALLQKAGIIKVWWDNRVEETREDYRGMTEIELTKLMQDDEIEPIEQKSYPDEDDLDQRQQAIEQLTQQLQQAMQGGQNPQAMQAAQQIQSQIEQINAQPPVLLYDVAFKRTKKSGKLCIEAVPPEEFLISRKAKSIKDATFVAHRVMRTVSDLNAMGYKNVDMIGSDDSQGAYSGERIERLGFDDEAPYLNSNDVSIDDTMRAIWVTECYIKADADGDGIAEWRKVVRAGNQILENEECDGAPFAALIPIVLPHRFFGLSIADLGFEAQRLQTQIVRAQVDNLFLSINKRHWVVEGQVNLDDFLTSRPGGAVRVKSPNAMGELGGGGGAAGEAMQMLEWTQDYTENATGWTRRSQGTGASGLQQQTATGMNLISNRDDMRLDLIARNFAEGGITDLFKLMLGLICKYQDKEEVINVSGGWMPVNPREWKNQFELTINVGLGTNNKEQQAQHLMGLMQIQEKALQIGVATPENVFNAAKLYAEAMGQKTGDKFFTDPSKQPPQQPKPDPEMMKAQAQTQIEQAKMQSAEKMHQLSLQADVQKHQALQATRQTEIQQQAQARQLELEMEDRKQTHQAQLDMQERQHQAELTAALEREKLTLKQYEIDRNNEVKIYVAELAAQATLTKQQDAAADMALNDESSEM